LRQDLDVFRGDTQGTQAVGDSLRASIGQTNRARFVGAQIGVASQYEVSAVIESL
jgi:hypothetical protein